MSSPDSAEYSLFYGIFIYIQYLSTARTVTKFTYKFKVSHQNSLISVFRHTVDLLGVHFEVKPKVNAKYFSSSNLKNCSEEMQVYPGHLQQCSHFVILPTN